MCICQDLTTSAVSMARHARGLVDPHQVDRLGRIFRNFFLGPLLCSDFMEDFKTFPMSALWHFFSVGYLYKKCVRGYKYENVVRNFLGL